MQGGFSYGLETDPEVAAKVLSRLNRSERHTHIAPHVPTVIPAKNRIPVKAVTEAFTKMPKKSAAHRNGWTWELLKDAAQRPSTATLLSKFAELFSNGELPQNLWSYLASVLIYPFHKHLLEDRKDPKEPALRSVTALMRSTRFIRAARQHLHP